MAMGKTVICSRVQGQTDIIQDGKTGFFVPQGNVQALREKILYLWNNPDVAASMGKEARKYVEENHSLDTFVHMVKDIVVKNIKIKNSGIKK